MVRKQLASMIMHYLCCDKEGSSTYLLEPSTNYSWNRRTALDETTEEDHVAVNCSLNTVDSSGTQLFNESHERCKYRL